MSTVVLLHGFASSAEETFGRPGWTRVLERAGHRVIARDLPGHGENDGASRPTRSDLLRWARALVLEESEAAQEPVDLVGYSLGSTLAWQVALEHPEAVGRVVMAGVPDRDHLREVGLGIESENTAFLRDLMERNPRQADLEAIVASSVEEPFEPAAHLAEGLLPPGLVLIAKGSEDHLALNPEDVVVAAREYGKPEPAAMVIQGRDHVSILPSGELRRAVAQALSA